jgi:hypothetical protein
MFRPDENIIIYTAGFFDGEGSVTIAHSHHDANAKRDWYHGLQLTITNTNYDVMRWLVDKWKIGTITEHEDFRKLTEEGCHRKESWHWRVGANDACFVLDCMFPYIIVKKTDSYICISFQKWKAWDSRMYAKGRPESSFVKEEKLRDLLLESRQGNFESVKLSVDQILENLSFENNIIRQQEQSMFLLEV